MGTIRDPRSVRFSYHIYQFLLAAYPRRFRQGYRDEMALLFRDSCREAYQERGLRGLSNIWTRAVVDLSANLPQEHVADLVTKDPPIPPTLIRCTFCSEEITFRGARCLYCGADLSDPLATATVTRPAHGTGNFSDDTPGSFIVGG